MFGTAASIAQTPDIVIPSRHTKEVTTCVFSPDNKVYATGSRDHTVKLWQTGTGELLRTFSFHRSDISQLFFSVDSHALFTMASDDTLAGLWDIYTGCLIKQIPCKKSNYYRSFCISPLNDQYAVLRDEHHLQVYSLANGSVIYDEQNDSERILSVNFSTVKDWLVLGRCTKENKGFVQVLSTRTWKVQYNIDNEDVFAQPKYDVMPYDNNIFYTLASNYIKTYSLNSENQTDSIAFEFSSNPELFFPKGKFCITDYGTVKAVYNIVSHKFSYKKNLKTAWDDVVNDTTYRMCNSGNYYIKFARNTEPMIFDAHTDKYISAIRCMGYKSNDGLCSYGLPYFKSDYDDKCLIAFPFKAGEDTTIYIHDLISGEPVISYHPGMNVTNAYFSPYARHTAVLTDDNGNALYISAGDSLSSDITFSKLPAVYEMRFDTGDKARLYISYSKERWRKPELTKIPGSYWSDQFIYNIATGELSIAKSKLARYSSIDYSFHIHNEDTLINILRGLNYYSAGSSPFITPDGSSLFFTTLTDQNISPIYPYLAKYNTISGQTETYSFPANITPWPEEPFRLLGRNSAFAIRYSDTFYFWKDHQEAYAYKISGRNLITTASGKYFTLMAYNSFGSQSYQQIFLPSSGTSLLSLAGKDFFKSYQYDLNNIVSANGKYFCLADATGAEIISADDFSKVYAKHFSDEPADYFTPQLLSNTGRYLVYSLGNYRKKVVIYDLKKDTAIASNQPDDYADISASVMFSQDDSYILLTNHSNNVAFFSLKSFAFIKELKFQESISGIHLIDNAVFVLTNSIEEKNKTTVIYRMTVRNENLLVDTLSSDNYFNGDNFKADNAGHLLCWDKQDLIIGDFGSGAIKSGKHPLKKSIVYWNKNATKAFLINSNHTAYLYDTTKKFTVDSMAISDTFKFYRLSQDNYMVCNDGSNIISTVHDSKRSFNIYSFDTFSKVINVVLPYSIGEISPIGQSPYLLAICRNSSVYKISIVTGKVVEEWNGHVMPIHTVAFSDDNRWLLSGDIKGDIFRWDLDKMKKDFSYNSLGRAVTDISISEDQKKFLTGAEDNSVAFWSVNNRSPLHTFYGHAASVNKVQLNSDATLAASADIEGAVKLWDLRNKKLLVTFVNFGHDEFITITPDNYFRASKNITQHIGYTAGISHIAFRQLDVKYNRPDKVLEAIGNADTLLINAYRMAYYKRIHKLKIDTNAFHEGITIPEVTFVNRDEIEKQPNKTSERLQLHIIAKDSADNLDRYNIYVNGSPIYGIDGVVAGKKDKHTIDENVTITLSKGRNMIEASVTNSNGIENYRIPLVFNFIPKDTVKEKLYFIGIGINHFADSSHDLHYCAQDIQDIADGLRTQYSGNIEVYTLFDEHVSADSILAMKKKLLHTTVNDKVIIAYSGHGLLSRSYDYYLSTYNINFGKPEEGGLPYDALESLLDSIPARQKLLLIDACNSGEVDKEELNHMKQTEGNAIAMADKRGLKIFTPDSVRLGMKNSFELMQNLFVNVGKNTGATVIAAAGGIQAAQERNEWGHGAFTYSILQYMQQHRHATVSELKNYVNNRVPELTNGLQQPVARQENIEYDWEMW